MRPAYTLSVGDAMFRPGVDPDVLMRTFEGREGTHTVPYIQSSSDAEFRIDFVDPELEIVELELVHNGEIAAEGDLTPDNPALAIMSLDDADYDIIVRGFDEKEEGMFEHRIRSFGVGEVIAAIGDSLTEGYRGHAFRVQDLDITAANFPPESVSADGRNYPQYAPTAYQHWPEFNTMESWLTDLNNLLSAALKRPIFISNEGWGGITAGQFLEMMKTDKDWQFRMQDLSPSLWLIHLGVNDMYADVPPAQFIANLKELTKRLNGDYGAQPQDICIALPSHDTNEGMAAKNIAYGKALRPFIADNGFLVGPDFSAGFKDCYAPLYTDFVHPNADGMRRMAQLWHDALVAAFTATPAGA